MSTGANWAAAFPLKSATEAVTAVCTAWKFYASAPRPDFNRTTSEPKLTKLICCYVRRVVAPDLGLLGTWAAENVIADLDPVTGKLIEERRTDIQYGWNDDAARQQLELVFEFKRLRATKSDRKHYLGRKGLQRFVTGMYSEGQERALMVGILLDSKAAVLPPLKAEFAVPALAAQLALVPAASGAPLIQPAAFAQADFDTEHMRPPPRGHASGRIKVSHMFLEFAYV